jgi:hypothetical protein
MINSEMSFKTILGFAKWASKYPSIVDKNIQPMVSPQNISRKVPNRFEVGKVEQLGFDLRIGNTAPNIFSGLFNSTSVPSRENHMRTVRRQLESDLVPNSTVRSGNNRDLAIQLGDIGCTPLGFYSKRSLRDPVAPDLFRSFCSKVHNFISF